MLEIYKGEKTLLDSAIRELQRQLSPRSSKINQKDFESEEKTVDRLSLTSFVEATSGLILEPWQNHMCERLQKLTYQKGQRILLHKPPQHGGSVIVSQRLPAYLIGDKPDVRVKLACYNIQHATKFTGINKTIMQSAEYTAMFQDPGLVIPARSADSEFYNMTRKTARDGQPSLTALGLRTGFVGQGADTLVIDDPYPSPQDAASPAIRESTWTFWTSSAKVRINENTNVVVMFHRYNEEDFAGQLIAEEGLKINGGQWELISYRAEWDGDTRAEVGGLDPIGREIGEYLSPRYAAQEKYYSEQKRNPTVWQAQFQGKPSAMDGSFFLVRKFEIIPRCPVGLVKVCFGWDIASSTDGDWTVGVLMGLGVDGLVYVLKVARFRKNTDERNKEMKLEATLARRLYPNVIIRLPQDPAAAGKDVASMFTKLFVGFDVEIKPVKGDKQLRADPWSQYVNAGLVKLVDFSVGKVDDNGKPIPSWVGEFVEEHRKFPNSTKKDQVDASSDAFSVVALDTEQVLGQDFDMYGISGESDVNTSSLLLAEKEMMQEIFNIDSNYDFGKGSDNEGVIVNGKIVFNEKTYNQGVGLADKQRHSTIRARRLKLKTKARNNQY